MLAFTRRWLAFRKTSPALRRGEIVFLERTGGLLAFERRVCGEVVRLVFNLAEETAEETIEAGFSAAFDLGGRQAGGRMALEPGAGAVLRRA